MAEREKKKRQRRPTAAKEFSGKVILERAYPGSKSERMAVKLDTGEEKFLLRRLGIKSYKDKTLEELVGKTIKCHAVKRGSRLYLQDVEKQ